MTKSTDKKQKELVIWEFLSIFAFQITEYNIRHGQRPNNTGGTETNERRRDS